MACRKPPSRASYCGRAKAKGRKRRSRSRRNGKRKKSCRPGKVTRNPFFNYLRWFRKKHCGMNMIQVAVEGAKCWCKMSDEQRRKFYKEACSAPKMRRGRKGKSRGRSRRRSRSRKGRGGRCGGGRSRRRKSRRRGSRGRSRTRSRSKCGGCNAPRRVRSICG